MKKGLLLGMTSLFFTSQLQAISEDTKDRISKVETRPSITVNKSDFKDYFRGGEVRIDMLYPNSDTKTHGGAYVTFEPKARTNWHSHPAGQHIIVTSAVGYYQAWGEPIQVIKAGDVENNMKILKRLITLFSFLSLFVSNSLFANKDISMSDAKQQIITISALAAMNGTQGQLSFHFKAALNTRISESSLYQHFKIITTMSPIQFQKKLRLEESKQLLLLRNMDISEVAFEVGYESPSQFSREFSRMYGILINKKICKRF